MWHNADVKGGGVGASKMIWDAQPGGASAELLLIIGMIGQVCVGIFAMFIAIAMHAHIKIWI